MLNRIIKYFLENKLVTILIILLLVVWGLITAPFGWKTGILPSDPVAVDAIPDIGENQQIVFTRQIIVRCAKWTWKKLNRTREY